ncbi:hypothetical protein D3C72_330970 [compost metagenome]
MTGNGAFHLAGIHVLATADDHVLEAVDDVDVTLLVHVGAVAGVHPAATQGLGGFLGVVPVAEHDVRAAHHHFAHGAARDRVVVFVDDAHGHPQPRPPGRTQPATGDAGGVMVFRAVGGDRWCGLGHAVALGELDIRQGFQGHFQQRYRNRRGAIGQAAQATQIMFGEFRVHDQHLQHGRHNQDVGDAFTLDSAHHVQRIEGRDEDARQPEQRNQDHPRQRRQMKHRRDVQGQGIGRHRHIGSPGHGRRPQVHVRLHDAFRPTGGAAGVHDAGQVVAAAKRIVDRRCVPNQLLVGEHAFRQRTVADMDEQRTHPGGAGDAFGHGQERVVDQQDAGVAVVQRINDFRHAPADVHRVDHAAAPPGREEIFEEAVGVQAQQADPVASLHAQLLQRTGEARHPVGQFGIGTTAVAKHGRQCMGALLQHMVQALGQIHGALL